MLLRDSGRLQWQPEIASANRCAYVQSRTRESPLAIVMLTLCRNSDFFLRASQPEPPASSSFSRIFSKYGLTMSSRVEFEANAAKVVKGDRDECQRRVH